MVRPSKAGLLLLVAAVSATLLEAWTVTPTASPRLISLALQKSASTSSTALRVSSSSPPPKASRNNFNVVLAPSVDSDDAFDNFKVGNCRVHRYAGRDAADSMETEYVMWYHGRSRAMQQQQQQHAEADNNNNNSMSKAPPQLPPLSTGRIGRAVSRNGLVWEKDTVGSVSEDVTGVSLGLNNESWWGFDTAHVGLGSVLLPLSSPAVMTADGVYLMYYMGGSAEETPVSDYIVAKDEDEAATAAVAALKDATLQGMNMKIGVALSQDGISWGRVEGDDPSGACMVPFSKTDPNQLQEKDRDNVNVREELYCAWPEVVVNTSTKKKGEAFVMYYSTMTKDDKQKSIAYAVSEDGFRWFKRGICIAPDDENDGDAAANALDAKGCARCCVVADAVFDKSTLQWTELENAWKMYYEGVSPIDNKHRIFAAESKDGMKWTKLGLAFDVGGDGAWDCKGVGSPHCVRCVSSVLDVFDGTLNLDFYKIPCRPPRKSQIVAMFFSQPTILCFFCLQIG